MQAAFLHRKSACQAIETAVQRGDKLSVATRREAKRAHGKRLPGSPARFLRLSPKRLEAIYRDWKARGDDALHLHYRWPHRDIPVPVKLAFFSALKTAPSMAAAYRQLKNPGRTYRTIVRLPDARQKLWLARRRHYQRLYERMAAHAAQFLALEKAA